MIQTFVPRTLYCICTLYMFYSLCTGMLSLIIANTRGLAFCANRFYHVQLKQFCNNCVVLSTVFSMGVLPGPLVQGDNFRKLHHINVSQCITTYINDVCLS